MYKILDVDYDRECLLEIFYKSKKNLNGIMYEVIDHIDTEFSVVKLFEEFNFIKFTQKNLFLGEIIKESPPYINPGNNGQIMFPLLGELEVTFYSYPGEMVEGRPVLLPNRKNQELTNKILSTKTETILVNKPTVINGLVTHSYKPSSNRAVIAALKLPLDYSWNEIIEFIEDKK